MGGGSALDHKWSKTVFLTSKKIAMPAASQQQTTTKNFFGGGCGTGEGGMGDRGGGADLANERP